MKQEQKKLVKKPNSLAEMRGNLDASFLDVLDMTLHIITNKIEQNPQETRYRLYVTDFAGSFNLNHEKNAYKKMRSLAHHAFANDKGIKITERNGKMKEFHVFASMEYASMEGYIDVNITQEFKEYINREIEEQGKKVIYSLRDTLQMASEYSKRFYPILRERVHNQDGDRMIFSAKGTLNGQEFDRIDTIEGFKEILSIPKKHKTSDVKDICETIIEDVKTFTDYTASVHYNEFSQGKGRPATTHICWRIEKKVIIEAEYIKDEDEKIVESEISGIETSSDEVMNDEDIQAESDAEEDTVEGQLDIQDVFIASKIKAILQLDDTSVASIMKTARNNNLNADYVIQMAENVAKKQDAKDKGAYLNWVLLHDITTINETTNATSNDKPKDTFNNFSQREYDFETLEKQLFNN